jgi:hypothetical protein
MKKILGKFKKSTFCFFFCFGKKKEEKTSLLCCSEEYALILKNSLRAEKDLSSSEAPNSTRKYGNP